ncbi:MAG: hypothetical protein V4592_18020 [Bacteroidota bacterium]
MRKKRLTALLICFICSCLLITVLYWFSMWRNNHPNGFLRKLPPHKIVGTGLIKLERKDYYLAGIDSLNVYLGRWAKRNQLLRVNYRTKDTSSLTISGLDTVRYHQGVYVNVDNQNIYLFDGIKPAVASGKLTNGKLTSIEQRVPYFTTSLSISQNSFILSILAKGDQNELVKVLTGKVMAKYTLEQQGDGFFSTDGALFKSSDGNHLFYSFYYRNRFLCLDTNLLVVYKGKTIDTVNHAKLTIGKIRSLNQTTLAEPPNFVNEQCAANSQYIFIHSALKADNETSAEMKIVNPIDVYRIKDGQYVFSIYIVNVNREKLRNFIVYRQTLIALYDHYLYIHQLKF